MSYKNKCEELIKQGVHIIDVNHTYIDENIEVGKGTVIYPNTSIRGNSKIGENNIIDMNSVIINSMISNNNRIITSYIEDSIVGNDNIIGPFAHIREHSNIKDHVVIGNFVEVKSSCLGEKTKAKHLTYLGDADIGTNVNIGGGVIVANVNFLTSEKNRTLICDNVKVGANSVLVSPIILNKNSLVAAGSTITQDVKENGLAVARTRQVNKNNYNNKESRV